MAHTLGRYEIVRPLARGGMAEVFVARRRGPGGVEKRLVVKCVRRERASDPRFAAMFVEEARLSMALAHKNLVSVFDFGRADDRFFLVMEYVDGISLGAALAEAARAGKLPDRPDRPDRPDPPDPIVVAFLGIEACQGLEYAHTARDPEGRARAIVHRDVTPGNLLLSIAGEVKLVDFGVASLAADRVGSVRGTPGYMSPEQARGEAVDPRSDLFSLGVCLWEALAGRPAFAGADAAERLQANRAGDLPPLGDHVPEALRRAVERATRADRDERWQDARSMQLALDDFLLDSRATRRTPPQHLLAAWLGPLVERAAAPPAIEPPAAAHVHTFLEDGAALAGATARSMAATIDEPEGAEGEGAEGEGAEGEGAEGEGAEAATPGEAAAPGGAAAAPGEETAVPARASGPLVVARRRRGFAVAAGTAFLAAVAVVIGRSGGPSSEAPTREAPSATAPSHEGTTASAPPGGTTGTTASTPTGAPRVPPGSAGSAGTPGTPAAAADAESTRPARPASAIDAPTRGDAALGPPRDSSRDRPPPGTASPAAGSHRTTPARSHGRRGAQAGGAEVAEGAEAAAPGHVQINASPWARVTVVGRSESCAETPCTLALPPGSYTLRLENPIAGVGATRRVAIQSGATVQVVETLTRPIAP